MSTYGLLGYPLAVSFSPAYFAQKFRKGQLNPHYQLFPRAKVDGLRTWLEQQTDVAGLNVTIPHKQAVLQYLDALTKEAQAAGAVNTIAIQRNPLRLTGHNTDVIGFRETLLSFLGDSRPAALVCGTGGAARAVWHVLQELGISFLKVGRSPAAGNSTYEALTEEQAQSCLLWINTSPLGMDSVFSGQKPPLPYKVLSSAHWLYDLVYHPAETPFLVEGRMRGAHTQNGLAMLYAQAEASWDFWQKF